MDWQVSLICPHCKAENWMHLGDVNDKTLDDPEFFECWQCGKRYFITPDGEVGLEDPSPIRGNNVGEPPAEHKAMLMVAQALVNHLKNPLSLRRASFDMAKIVVHQKSPFEDRHAVIDTLKELLGLKKRKMN